MNTDVATISSHAGWRPDESSGHHAITRMVEEQEKAARLVPKVAFWGPFALFILFGLTSGFGGSLGFLLGLAFTYLFARLLVRGLRTLVLQPMRRVRYDRAAARLCGELGGGHVAVGPFSWTLGAPGAMAMTRTGEVIILDRRHGYDPLVLRPNQIADVRVEHNSQQFTRTLHSGRTTVGGFGKSFGIGYTMAGSSTSLTSTVNEYFLEIRYQLQMNGPVSTVIVPGGPERRVVEELCATIRRLEPA